MKLLPRSSWAILLALFAATVTSHAQDSTDGLVINTGVTGGTLTLNGATTENSGTLSLGTGAGIGLVKTGTGTLVFGSTNTFSDGTVILSSNNTIGDGTVILSDGNTFTGGTIVGTSNLLTLTDANTLTQNSNGGVILVGSDSLILTGVNTYTSGTIIGTSTILNSSGTILTLESGKLSEFITNGNGILIFGPGGGNMYTLNSTGTTALTNSQIAPLGLPEPSVIALLFCGAALGLRRPKKR